MEQLQAYKCPCCGASINFDSTAQAMKCPYCDTEFELETLQSFAEDEAEQKEGNMVWDTNGATTWDESEAAALRSYACQSCGGEIVSDATTSATSCPYCDSPVIVKQMVQGGLKPDYVIPFKVDKKAAIAALKRHYEGKKFLPKVFKDQNHIDEIKGIYVPVWLFDANADATIRYRGTKIRHWSDRQYNYTETSHYRISRGGTLSFSAVPVDGSEKIDNKLMESLEPFKTDQAVDFNTAYLSGFFADRYDADANTCVERANERVTKSTEERFAKTVSGYTSVTPESTRINLENGTAKYALFPVWILNTVWNKQTYTFAMNGQTGKFVGDLPMDKGIYRKWLFGIAGLISAAVFALLYLFWLI